MANLPDVKVQYDIPDAAKMADVFCQKLGISVKLYTRRTHLPKIDFTVVDGGGRELYLKTLRGVSREGLT